MELKTKIYNFLIGIPVVIVVVFFVWGMVDTFFDFLIPEGPSQILVQSITFPLVSIISFFIITFIAFKYGHKMHFTPNIFITIPTIIFVLLITTMSDMSAGVPDALDIVLRIISVFTPTLGYWLGSKSGK